MQRIYVGSVFLVAVVCAQSQTLSPREIFYGQGRATAAPKTSAAAKPKPSPPKTTPIPEPAAEPQVAAVSPERPPDRVVSLVSSKIGPLGLKYSVLKRGPNGEYSEVDPDENFTAHDHIKVSIEVNDPGYLYVVAQGTSGIWKVLYPSAEVDGGDNRVREGRKYNIPNDAVFSFDTRAGTEKLFVVLSRQPEKDIDSLIYSLRDKPSQESKHGEVSRPLMASNNAPIQDDLVQRLKQTYSRDLVIEKVDDSKTPPSEEVKKIEVKHGALIPPGEKAVYVVNRNAGENARVVADVELKHQ